MDLYPGPEKGRTRTAGHETHHSQSKLDQLGIKPERSPHEFRSLRRPSLMCPKRESPALARGAFSVGRDSGEAPVGPKLLDYDYFGCSCWSALVAGAEELLESCSRSFFNRLISTRPPLMCLASAPSTGALPIPTR